jgi:UDP-N-acetylmuramoyl-tripeptide--D-alanyl-D-alanine ligase
MRPINTDSRTIQPGDIFIPIKGPNFDGRQFIDEAIRKGAILLDVDLESYARKYRKKLQCAVIGVTGSAGKTTVKDLLATVLSQKYEVIKTLENQNNEIGAPLTLIKADAETEILIVEMGMRNRGEIRYLSKLIRPTHVVITNIGMAHIENLGTQRNIALAKSEMFNKPLSWETSTRYAFLNFNTPFYSLQKKKAEQAGFVVLPFKGEDRPDENINLCYTVAHQFGLTEDQIQAGLMAYQSSAHRLKVSQINGITVIDDTYNANPDGVAYALAFLRRYSGRKIIVLGDMLELGAFSKQAHQAIVPLAIDAGVDIVYTHGPAFAEIESPDIPHYAFQDRQQLHAHLLPELKPGDVVLVKGSRGMKMEETVTAIERVKK